MTEPILLTPIERSLTQGGAGDLSLYGVQADPVVAFAAVDPVGPSVDPLGATVDGTPVPASPGISDGAVFDFNETTPSTLTPPAAAIVAPNLVSVPARTDDFERPVDQPAGSSTSSAVLDTGGRGPDAGDQTVSQPAETASTSGGNPIATASVAGGDLVSVPLSPAVQAWASSAQEGLEEAVDRAGSVADAIDDAASDAVAALSDTISASTGVLAGVVTPVVEIAGGLAVAADGEGVGSAVAAATDPVLAVAPAASATMDDALDLLGPDPAGGVATLVSLVTAADMFELTDPAPQDEGVVVAADDLLDSLADDTPLPGALLGDGGEDDAPVPLPDDLPLG